MYSTSLARYLLSSIIFAACLLHAEGSKELACPEWADQTGAYKALSAANKEACVMKMVMASKGQRAEFLNDTEFFSMATGRDMGLSFGPGDKLPYEGVKVFHTVGFVAAVEFISPVQHAYSGLFQGAPYGVIRLGLVHGSNEIEETGGMDYAAGVKFFKDSMNSSDLVASLDNTQTSGNFFEQKLSSWINEDNEPTTEAPDDDFWRTLVIGMQFEEVGEEQRRQHAHDVSTVILNVTELSTHTFEGKIIPEDEINSPFLVTLMPNETLKETFKCVELGSDLFKSTFSQIPAGTVIYHVHVQAYLGAEPDYIGYIKTKSPFFDTLFGDTELRFAHAFHDAIVQDESDEQDNAPRNGCPYRK